MIAVKVICVGKLKEAFYQQACAEYEKRLKGFCRLEVVELPEDTRPGNLAREAEKIRQAIPQGSYTVALCIEGSPDFYGRSGFAAAGARGICCGEEPETASYFLLKELRPGFLDGVTGVYHTPQGYYVDEAAADAFDRNFPPKEKLKLPGQLF